MKTRITSLQLKDINQATVSVENLAKQLKNTNMGPISIKDKDGNTICIIFFADESIVVEFD